MGIENFSTWTEVDSGNYLTINGTQVTFADLLNQANTYLYKAESTSLTFVHEFEFRITNTIWGAGIQFWTCLWAIRSVFGRMTTTFETVGLFLDQHPLFTTNIKLFLGAMKNGLLAGWDRSILLSKNVTYYVRITRNINTFTVDIYSDYTRVFLVDSISINVTGTALEDFIFSYIQVMTAWVGVGGAAKISGWMQNLDFSPSSITVIFNTTRSLIINPITWKEAQSVDVGVRPVPTRSAGPKVDTGMYQPHLRELEIKMRLSDSEKTTLQNMFDDDEKVTIETNNNWTYTGWLKEKPIMYEYSKHGDGTERVWLVTLKLYIETFSYTG